MNWWSLNANSARPSASRAFAPASSVARSAASATPCSPQWRPRAAARRLRAWSGSGGRADPHRLDAARMSAQSRWQAHHRPGRRDCWGQAGRCGTADRSGPTSPTVARRRVSPTMFVRRDPHPEHPGGELRDLLTLFGAVPGPASVALVPTHCRPWLLPRRGGAGPASRRPHPAGRGRCGVRPERGSQPAALAISA